MAEAGSFNYPTSPEELEGEHGVYCTNPNRLTGCSSDRLVFSFVYSLPNYVKPITLCRYNLSERRAVGPAGWQPALTLAAAYMFQSCRFPLHGSSDLGFCSGLADAVERLIL